MNRTRLRLALLLLLAAAAAAFLAVLAAPAAHAEDGIAWRHRATLGRVTLTANPLAGEQRTAFYLARGFSAAAIRPYAGACGFSIGLQNGGGAALLTRIDDWRAVDADGRTIRLRLPEAWDADWKNAGVAPAARIAFRWAQFQAENRFEPGDWIMGMATLEHPPTAPFRLLAGYHDDNGRHEITLDGLSCAAD